MNGCGGGGLKKGRGAQAYLPTLDVGNFEVSTELHVQDKEAGYPNTNSCLSNRYAFLFLDEKF